jgi:stringent starvation protein B
MTPTLPSKKEVVLALLERSSVFIHLDPRRDQVVVPPWFKKQARLVLQVGLNMVIPIRDLNVDDECVSCTLSFNRSPYFCWIPWHAVFALVGEDQRGMVWPDDVPPELTAQAAEGRPASGAPGVRTNRPHLRSVRTQDPEPESAPKASGPASSESNPEDQPLDPAAGQSAAKPKSKRPSHLRVVK